ncbi:sulfatase family protein [Allorhodopirellula heiligendammensis]|uniref:Arylsulfatase n=1 Tax=Allorhodopirellula heiligendammensis TaxID=2714739 RepID=A0A5C6BD15_9BACT|nr:sulfatase-like hydrolase/transferase [Allorhodopirellula heiligendammensis]TWU10115.1 Arylsulfatase precursor [Allorhodopirellula heiligendammensis]
MMQSTTTFRVCLVIGLSLATVSNAAAKVERPNIIVFYTDDHGYADMSCQGVIDDISTPNVDALARTGVLARHGYSTAPQCVPSRAGLLVGKFQSKFGVESNGHSLAGFDRELTIAERLQKAGYITAQFGKWHLGPGSQIVEHGFKHVFNQNSGGPFVANINLDGSDRELSTQRQQMYHIDACSQAAASLIERYRDHPFFLYVAYRAPHVPLDAPQQYLDRFPGEMPERRRQALAMLSAVDDGVGLITRTLAQHRLRENTLIFYIGDNGAPLKIHKLDAPGGGPGWDGSLNDPLNGEKGMLSEGGMHVPFVACWPGTIPAGLVFEHPVSALDVAATSAELAMLESKPEDFDGVNLIPYFTGARKEAPHEFLAWRWSAQSAIREGDWKLLRGGDREYLYNLKSDLEEQHNLADEHPEIADRLREKLSHWASKLDPPGLANGDMSKAATDYFDFYLDGKPASPAPKKFLPNSDSAESKSEMQNLASPWTIRGGKMTVTREGLRLEPHRPDAPQAPFITRNGLNLAGPVSVRMVVKTTASGALGVSWRTSMDESFVEGNRVNFAAEKSDQWQTIETRIPIELKVIHVRIHLPPGTTSVKSVELIPTTGPAITLIK